jgi:hypothetical protein
VPQPLEQRLEEAPELAHPRVVFVGGTGRSGTHVVARLLGRHSTLANYPNEARFHTDPGGFPDLLAGRATPEAFLERLRGTWWRGIALHRMSVKGLHRHVDPDDFERACERFAAGFDADPEDACRELFFALLAPVAEREGKPGLIEQSCDTAAQAPTLIRLFPDARFIHVVRDGRDAAASRIDQANFLARPRTMRQGLDWWEARMRRIDAGLRELPDESYMAISLDELIDLRRRRSFERLRRFLGLGREDAMVGTFRREIGGGEGNVGRWRRRGGERYRRRVDARYGAILDGFERDGVNGWRMLRRVYEARP